MADIDEKAMAQEGETVLTLGWDGRDAPGHYGSVWIKRWRGAYFVTSSEWNPCGPFSTVEQALNEPCFTFEATPNPALTSEYIPMSKLIEIGRNLVSEGGIIVINGNPFELFGGKLYSGVTHRDLSSSAEV